MIRLKHENIMKVLDHFEDDNVICIVMDLMANDLRKLVFSNGQQGFDEIFACILFAKMVHAVCYCHQNFIVHRDIKMENFLIDLNENYNEIEVKLTDFGFSKKFKKGKFQSGSSGTAMTMAPEVIKNKSYNEKSDIWSLGIILFELLTGAIPFFHEDDKIIKLMIRECHINFTKV